MSQSEKTPAATQQPTYAEQQYPPQSQHDITQAPPQYYQPAVAQDRSNGSPAPSPAPQQSEQQQQPPQDQTKSAQAGFHPQTQPGVNMVPGVVPLNQLGDTPQWIDCPFCQKRTQTRLDKEGTPMQIVAGVLCCFLCVCLACVPCIAGWFEDTNYFCSACNKKVASRPDKGGIEVYGPPQVVPSQFQNK